MSPEKYDTLVALLRRKKNIILQGAPGVGKTYAAKRLAWSMMGQKDDSRIEFIQFHQNYAYEDFVLGYKPAPSGFALQDGVFYRFCDRAQKDPNHDFFFIMDEINRGNLSKIFGELLMAIENEHREEQITLAHEKRTLAVPKNLHLIGMMNTADRSLAMIDYALRRRFAFFEMEPGFESELFRKQLQGADRKDLAALVEQVKLLNKEIANDPSLGRGFRIGHSYFCNGNDDAFTPAHLREVVDYEIVPLLEEYWFDDPEKAEKWSNNLRNCLHG